MELWRFVLVSSLEYIAIIALMIAVFRFSIRIFIPHTVFICLVQSSFSYFIRVEGLANYSSLLQVILFVICISLLYRLRWYYAIVMGVIGYQSYVSIQAVLFIIISAFGFLDVNDVNYYQNFKGVLFVVLCVMVSMLIGNLIYQKGWGFTFIPTGISPRIKIRGINLAILFLSLMSALMIGSTFYFVNTDQQLMFYVLCFLQLLILTCLILYSYRKERQENG